MSKVNLSFLIPAFVIIATIALVGFFVSQSAPAPRRLSAQPPAPSPVLPQSSPAPIKKVSDGYEKYTHSTTAFSFDKATALHIVECGRGGKIFQLVAAAEREDACELPGEMEVLVSSTKFDRRGLDGGEIIIIDGEQATLSEMEKKLVVDFERGSLNYRLILHDPLLRPQFNRLIETLGF